jgi:serine/threonine protein kinase
VWGIGMVLFEAVTGRLPFDFVSGSEFPQLEGPALKVRKGVPTALAHTIDAMLQPDPNSRPTIDTVAETLLPLIAEAPAWLRR